MNIRRFFARCAPLLAVSLIACQPAAQPDQAPLAGAAIGGDFALTDQNGRSVTSRSFAGKYRIMYFGYTFCPDICPTDMQRVGAALTQLDKSDADLAKRIVPIFVTIDPARDTPAVLKQFIAAFHPRMVGLTGSPAAIAKVAKEYAVFFAKGDATPGGYLMDHSSQTYLMDPDGEPLALLPTDQGADAIVAEIKRWAR